MLVALIFDYFEQVQLIPSDKVRSSKKKRKAVNRLNIKRKVKRLLSLDKGLTGFEHLQGTKFDYCN